MWGVIPVSAFLFASSVAGPALAASRPTREATVVHVEDGDTIDVRLGDRVERVRYVGMDAPEVPHFGVGGQRGGAEAARLNEALVGSRRVRLELARQRRDRYGRLLAYVWVGDAMINLEMVRRGYARTLTIPPNVRYQRWFARAESEARAAGLGLWRGGYREHPSRRARSPTLAPRARRHKPQPMAHMRPAYPNILLTRARPPPYDLPGQCDFSNVRRVNRRKGAVPRARPPTTKAGLRRLANRRSRAGDPRSRRETHCLAEGLMR